VRPWLATVGTGHTHDDEFSLFTIDALKEQVCVRTGNPIRIPVI